MIKNKFKILQIKKIKKSIKNNNKKIQNNLQKNLLNKS